MADSINVHTHSEVILEDSIETTVSSLSLSKVERDGKEQLVGSYSALDFMSDGMMHEAGRVFPVICNKK